MKSSDASVFVTEWLVRADISNEVVSEFFHQIELDEGDIDLGAIERVGTQIHVDALKSEAKGSDLDEFEIGWSVRVYEAFCTLPLCALGDREFWTYCSARFFWGFVVLRQHSTVVKGRRALLDSLLLEGTPRDDGASDEAEEETEAGLPIGLLRYVVGKDHYQIPLRLFLRGQAVRGDSDFLKKNPTERATDFWRSQLLGVRTGAYPNWARPIVEAQSAHKLPVTGSLRVAGRTVNRLRANVSPILHTEDDAKAIIDPIWASASKPRDPK